MNGSLTISGVGDCCLSEVSSKIGRDRESDMETEKNCEIKRRNRHNCKQSIAPSNGMAVTGIIPYPM